LVRPGLVREAALAEVEVVVEVVFVSLEARELLPFARHLVQLEQIHSAAVVATDGIAAAAAVEGGAGIVGVDVAGPAVM
jgi:hypothetical protein